MNKRNKAKLSSLREALQRHEEKFEQSFPAKTVAIIKHRVGLEDGEPHYAKDTAKVFKISESWVNKAQKQVEVFLREQDKKAPQATAKGEDRSDPVMKTITAEIDWETNVVKIEAEDSSDIEQIREVCINSIAIGRNTSAHAQMRHRARKYSDKATVNLLWSIVAGVIGAVLMYGTASHQPEHEIAYYGIALSMLLVSVFFSARALKLYGKSEGFYEGRTTL